MKAVQFICILAMLCLARGTSQGALDFITTTSNGDPDSCLLNLTYTVAANKITFFTFQYIPDPSNPDCTFQDIQTAPMWYIPPFSPVQLNLTANGTNHFKGVFQYSDFNAAKGESCFLVGNFNPGPQEVYGCRFRWSSIFFYMYIRLAASNTSFDTTWTGLLYPELSAKQSTKYGKSIWIPDPNFPHIVGKIENGCGVNNWDNVINNLSTHATVTGTEYMSNTFDLHAYLNGTYLAAAYAVQSGAAFNTYKHVQVSNDTFQSQPFQANSAQECTDLGIKYSAFIPNLNYCTNGCYVSYIVGKQVQAYMLITNGIHTATRRLRT